MRYALPVALAVVIALGLSAVWMVTRTPQVALSPAMLNVDGADIGAPFELTDHNGNRVTSAALLDSPALMYFGYTFCPDVCPIDVQIMADAIDLLDERNVDVKPIFVTVDPARDTAEELAFYAEAMHPKMVALTGSESEIKTVATDFKVFYQRVDVEGSEADYLMQHTAYMYLMAPDGSVAAMFRRDFPASQIADDIQRVLDAL